MKTKSDVLKSLLNKEVRIYTLTSGGNFISDKLDKDSFFNYIITDVGEDIFTTKKASRTHFFSIANLHEIIIS